MRDKLSSKMQMRAAAVAVASCLSMTPALTEAASLGKITVLSGMGQPLRAEIEVTASREELSGMVARLASRESAQLGGDATAVLSDLRFSLDRRQGGASVIRVSSGKPVNEPFLNFFVELNWPSGRLVREYVFLLDPPEVAAKAKTRPVATAEARGAVAETKPVAKPAAVERAELPVKPSGSKVTARVVEPKPAAEGAKSAAADQREVRSGDTLSKIAREAKPEGVSLDQMMVGIFQNNADAFAGGNVNRLKKGVILNLPNKEAVAAIPEAEARKVLQTHVSNWGAYRQKMAAAVEKTPAKVDAGSQAAAGKITAKVDDKAVPVQAAKDQVKVTRTEVAGKGAASGEKAAKVEDLIAKEKALKEANERLKLLEKNVAELQKLVEMKNKSLAELQKQAASRQTIDKAAEKKAAEDKAAAEKKALADKAAAEKKAAEEKAAADKAAAEKKAAADKKAAEDKAAAEKKAAEDKAAAEKKALADKAAEEKAAAEKKAVEDKAAAEKKTAEEKTAAEPTTTTSPATTTTQPVTTTRPVTTTTQIKKAPPPPEPESGGLTTVLAALGGVAVLAAAAVGALFYKRRRAKAAGGMATDAMPVVQSSLGPNSVFRNTGGQSVDTGTTPQSTDFSQTGPGTIDTDEVDPVAEADVYMAYGRDAQAEEILLEALQKDPHRIAIHVKLLEIYANRKSVRQFETLATELFSQTNGVGAEWEKVAAMGAKLDPANPLYTGGKPAGQAAFSADATMVMTPEAMQATVAMPGAMAQMAEAVPEAKAETPEQPAELMSLDFDLGTTTHPTAVEPAAIAEPVSEVPEPSPEPAAADSLDFDLGLSTPAVEAESVATGQGEEEAGTGSLDFDLGLTSTDFTGVDVGQVDVLTTSQVAMSATDLTGGFSGGLTESTEAPAVLEEASPEQAAGGMEFDVQLTDSVIMESPLTSSVDIGSINLDLAAELPAAGAAAVDLASPAESLAETEPAAAVDPRWEEVSTKLDLAKAYEEMGDLEGARELLHEVIAEGPPELVEQARTVLARVGE